MSRVPLSEGKVKVPHLKTAMQKYYINYRPKESEYCDKIELKITLEDGGILRQRPSSIQFADPMQLMSFIMELVKSYFLFSRYRKTITPLNYQPKIKEFMDKVRQNLTGEK